MGTGCLMERTLALVKKRGEEGEVNMRELGLYGGEFSQKF